MRKVWKWCNANRKRRIGATAAATLLLAGGALAYYISVISDGTGTVTYGKALGSNNNASVTFSIVENPGTPGPGQGSEPALQPSTTECFTSGSQLQANASCQPFNLQANVASIPKAGTIDSVSLASVTLPSGCPEDSIRVIWPDGQWTDGTGAGEVTYNEPTSLSGSGGTLNFTANQSALDELFPAIPGVSANNAPTQSFQPLIWLWDDGQNQNACAGGDLTLKFSAHASYL